MLMCLYIDLIKTTQRVKNFTMMLLNMMCLNISQATALYVYCFCYNVNSWY